jgi:Holliday junction resolvasome RuvABC endonuclease subunit
MTVRIASVFPALPADPAPVTVLGLDQSTSCGWAVLNGEMKRPVWGVLKLPTGDDETPGLRALHDHIAWAVTEHGVSHVYFEQGMIPQHQTTMGTLRQFMFIAAIQLATNLLLDRSAEQVAIATWRKYFTGVGAAPKHDLETNRKLDTHPARRKWWKAAALKACLDRGWLVAEHDAAEAIGIATYGLACSSPAFHARQGPLFRRAEMRGEVRP